jgi:parvulin-like peptidyl-prolyl isomerase
MYRRLDSGVSSGARRGTRFALCFALATVAAATVRAENDDEAVALVNGHPISSKEMVDILIEGHGVGVLQQLIMVRVAKDETKRRGIRVTKADIDAEFGQALNDIAENAGMTGEYATDRNKREALRQVLDERGVSLAEFMLGMERNAHLRKLVEKDLRITPETLREEFARTHGEKVHVSHIQIDQRDTRGLNEVVDLLNRGADFADVARRLSKNPETAPRGGEMEPFTFSDPDIPPTLREAAFSLKEGGVSNPVLAGQYFHILKLHRRIPASGVRLEDVREEVEQSLRKRAIPRAMEHLAVELFVKADISVLDSKLRTKYQEYLDKGMSSTPQP